MSRVLSSGSFAPSVSGGVSPRPPFAHLEAAFAVLAAEPAPLALPLDGGLTPVGDLAARGVLPGRSPAPAGWADRVWSQVIGRVRAQEAAWAVAAAGLALPGLRRTERRFGRLDPDDRDDVQQELLAAFLTAAHTLDTGTPQIARRLLRAADRAGQAWAHRHRTLAAWEAPLLGGVFPGDRMLAGRAPAGHPDLVLDRAVRAGVLDAGERDLIGETRLGAAGCAPLAAACGQTSRRVQRRRKRAERRLAQALRDHRV
ncbi:hypothetical protein LO772_08400 [Yinghuangia sp. ASG 101]|uniref:hypothetical protein n=1 Tax=Yinghuangia sp. ASG 101 TaxID=2896848 RepID=UPI001E348507|nr:hypothetical protein [Yinghuangia sp. ASG 101]UGQ13608.1 hypothetical protein LO772_08400 [Yinghuangia sp. ASG 101]